jgi:hypothetical protein
VRIVTQEIRRRAGETIRAAGLHETGLAVVEGFATPGARTFDNTLGDVIPGAAALVNRHRRIVLVTDRNVYVFQGARHDRPGQRLATYPLGSDAFSYDGQRLRFRDGEIVFVTRFQAESLSAAAHGAAGANRG